MKKVSILMPLLIASMAIATQEEILALVKSDLIPTVEERDQNLEALPRPEGDEETLEAYYQALDDAVSALIEEPESIVGDSNSFVASHDRAEGP